MKTRSSAALSEITCGIAAFLCAAAVIADLVSTTVFLPAIAFSCTGLLFVAVSFFIKEKWLYTAAAPMYIIFLFLGMYTIFMADNTGAFSYRHVYLGPVAFNTLLFLSLTVCFVARLISKYKSFNLLWLTMILTVVSLIFFMLLCQTHLQAIVICLILGLIVYTVMCKENRIGGHRINKLFVPLLLVLLIILIGVTIRDYQLMRVLQYLEVIFTRGENAPLTSGWARSQFDEVICTAKLFGENGFVDMLPTASLFYESNIFILLIKYGWVAALAVIFAAAAIIVLVWKMASGIKNSSFMRYVSLISALVLTAQFVYALLGIFVFPSVYVDIPFAGCSNSINLMNFILLGFIITGYTNRNKVSVIKESEVFDVNTIRGFAKWIISDEEETEEDGEIE